jgi:hypothetical protein
VEGEASLISFGMAKTYGAKPAGPWIYDVVRTWKEPMKPPITKLATVPKTTLLCCPQCYRLISYDGLKSMVECDLCGATVRAVTAPASFDQRTIRSS